MRKQWRVHGPRVNGKRIIVIRASRGNDQLAMQLAALGGNVTQVIAHQHSDVTMCDTSINEAVSNGEVTGSLSSSATAESLHRMFPTR